MKVQMLRNAASRYGVSLAEGETGDVEDSIGAAIVKDGIALEVDEPKPAKVKAKPEADKPADSSKT